MPIATTITQHCPSCQKVVAATLTYEYKDFMLVGDTSTCPCGLVLWEWHMGQPARFVNRGYVTVAKKEESRGQMRLF